jgi:hypothetical protein
LAGVVDRERDVEDLTMFIRPLGLRCATCLYYVHTPNAAGVLLGECRRRAPLERDFPLREATEWCGEHRLGELKPLPLGDDPDGDGLPLHDPKDCRFCQEQAGGVPFAPED